MNEDMTDTHDAKAPIDGKAVASLVLGVLALLGLGPIAGIPAVILGHVALRRTNRPSPARSGRGLSIAGLVLGYVATTLTLILVAGFYVTSAQRVEDRLFRAEMKMRKTKDGYLGEILRQGHITGDDRLYGRWVAIQSEGGIPFCHNQSGLPCYVFIIEFERDEKDASVGKMVLTYIFRDRPPTSNSSELTEYRTFFVNGGSTIFSHNAETEKSCSFLPYYIDGTGDLHLWMDATPVILQRKQR